MEFNFDTIDKFEDRIKSFSMKAPKICDILEASADGSTITLSVIDATNVTIDNRTIQFITNLVKILGKFEMKDKSKFDLDNVERCSVDFFMTVYLSTVFPQMIQSLEGLLSPQPLTEPEDLSKGEDQSEESGSQ